MSKTLMATVLTLAMLLAAGVGVASPPEDKPAPPVAASSMASMSTVAISVLHIDEPRILAVGIPALPTGPGSRIPYITSRSLDRGTARDRR